MTEVAARYRDVSFTPETGLGSRVYRVHALERDDFTLVHSLNS